MPSLDDLAEAASLLSKESNNPNQHFSSEDDFNYNFTKDLAHETIRSEALSPKEGIDLSSTGSSPHDPRSLESMSVDEADIQDSPPGPPDIDKMDEKDQTKSPNKNERESSPDIPDITEGLNNLHASNDSPVVVSIPDNFDEMEFNEQTNLNLPIIVLNESQSSDSIYQGNKTDNGNILTGKKPIVIKIKVPEAEQTNEKGAKR